MNENDDIKSGDEAPLDGTARSESTPSESREELLGVTGSDYTKIRQLLVQRPDTSAERASTLARMVSGRKHRALVLYLFLLANWSWVSKRTKDDGNPLHSKVWIRALTADGIPGALTWNSSTLSRAWADLDELGLVTINKVNRFVDPQPWREDSAALPDGEERVEYRPPKGQASTGRYFALPHVFWTDDLFAKLSFPGLAMFLVILKETNGVKDVFLQLNRLESWYGLKPSTVDKGIAQLKNLKMLVVRTTVEKSAFHPDGKHFKLHYSLKAPYSFEARAEMQERSMKEREARLEAQKSVKKRRRPVEDSNGD